MPIIQRIQISCGIREGIQGFPSRVNRNENIRKKNSTLTLENSARTAPQYPAEFNNLPNNYDKTGKQVSYR